MTSRPQGGGKPRPYNQAFDQKVQRRLAIQAGRIDASVSADHCIEVLGCLAR